MKSNRTYIIAEISANHGNSIEIVYQSIDAIKELGADAIKIQTYTPDSITLDIDKPEFMANPNGPWAGTRLYDLYEKAALPIDWTKDIFQYCKNIGLDCFSSPFSKKDVDILIAVNNPIYKIASFEITDVPLIKYAAAQQKPMIISTGIAGFEDIKLAIETCRSVGNNDITILQCTSQYPSLPEDANLLTIKGIMDQFGVKSGLSDHTEGIEAPVLAVAMGATVIEKHFILDKSIGGPDAHFSLDKEEFQLMVSAVRKAEKMIGKITFELTPKKQQSRDYSRSIYAQSDIKCGELLTTENIKTVRPAFGLHPKYWERAIGSKSKKDITKGEPLKREYFE